MTKKICLARQNAQAFCLARQFFLKPTNNLACGKGEERKATEARVANDLIKSYFFFLGEIKVVPCKLC